jgi:hypothetical protein
MEYSKGGTDQPQRNHSAALKTLPNRGVVSVIGCTSFSIPRQIYLL